MSEMWGRTLSCCVRSSQEPSGVSGLHSQSLATASQHLEENMESLTEEGQSVSLIKTSLLGNV